MVTLDNRAQGASVPTLQMHQSKAHSLDQTFGYFKDEKREVKQCGKQNVNIHAQNASACVCREYNDAGERQRSGFVTSQVMLCKNSWVTAERSASVSAARSCSCRPGCCVERNAAGIFVARVIHNSSSVSLETFQLL